LKTTEIQCINCAMRCEMEVLHEGDTLHEVQWNNCRRGEAYAIARMDLPRRMVNTHLPVRGGVFANVPVRSLEPIEEDSLDGLLGMLSGLELTAPLTAGDVVEISGVSFRVMESVAAKK